MPKDFHDLPNNHDLTGQQKPMRSSGKPNDVQRDEERLLPNFGKKSDVGVPIIPGKTVAKKNKPAQQFSAQPVDRISKKARQSGPVRAQGKPKSRTGREANKGPDSEEHAADFEHSGRAAKRQRTNPQKTYDKAEGDEVMEQALPILEDIPLGDSTPPRSRRTPGLKRQTNRTGGSRQIENVTQASQQSEPDSNKPRHPQSDDDELFMENAAKERCAVESSDEDLNNNQKTGTFQSFEIPRPKKPHEKDVSASPSLQRQYMNAGKVRRGSDSSSDVLQGEATVSSVPSGLPVGRKKEVSSESDVEAGKPVRQESSPSNIRPTNFSPSNKAQKKRNGKKPQKKDQSYWSFGASSVRIGTLHLRLADRKPVKVHVDFGTGKLKFEGNMSGSTQRYEHDLRKFMQVIHGEGSSCKVRLGLSKTEHQISQIDIELISTEARDDFCGVLRKQTVKFQPKDSKWMDDAFKRAEKDSARHSNGSKRLSTEGVSEPASEPKTELPKRQKLSDSLQVDNGTNATSPNHTHKVRLDSSATDHNPKESFDHSAHAHPPRPAIRQSVEIAVNKPLSEAPSSRRETRSSKSHHAPPTTVVCDDDDGDDQQPQSAPFEKSQRWERPLVYPRFGKKKAEVDAQDRERLRDNEFLNDNLIGFYIRFLEDHLDRTNKDAARRVYFFNSYFYATLTNNPKSKKLVNYESVQKWTRSVDIFSYDYIVIPINEAAHWYVAIICNLSNMHGHWKGSSEAQKPADSGQGSSQPEAEVQTVLETPFSSQDVAPQEGAEDQKPKSEPPKEEMAAMSLDDKAEANKKSDQEIPASDEDWPEMEENLTLSSTRFSSPPKTRASQQKGLKDTPKSKPSSRKPRKQKKNPQESRNPHDPIIITFDSLDQTRSHTVRNLRQYLSEEAKSKKGIEIDTTMMGGLRARSIPLQSNYSDCGLYLLAYMEKFVQDPDLFVSRLLLEEMKVDTDWPPLTSNALRLRLRRFLDDLHDEQDELSREQANEGRTLADRQPVSFLLGKTESEQTEWEAEAPPSKPSSPQPEKAPEPAAPTETERKSQERVHEAPIPLQGPSTTPSVSPDIPARNPRQKKGSRPIKALRSIQARLLGKSSQQTDQGADGEVVEVPDSQEPQTQNHPNVLDLSSPKESSDDDGVKTDVVGVVWGAKSGHNDSVTIDDDDDDDESVVEERDPHGSPKGQRIEVLVKETPPPEGARPK